MIIGMNPYPVQHEQPCELCNEHIDACKCPECSVCGYIGDPKCYQQHGMKQTARQRAVAMQRELDRAVRVMSGNSKAEVSS